MFRGVSSGACNKYALKMITIENKKKFGKEAAQTLQNNLYVDELLKSVENDDVALQLTKKVTGMRHEGGFNLTEFTSNSKTVLQSIPGERQTIRCEGQRSYKKSSRESSIGRTLEY